MIRVICIGKITGRSIRFNSIFEGSMPITSAVQMRYGLLSYGGLRAGDDDAGRERLGGRLERFNYRLRPQCIINDSHSLTSRHLSLPRPCFSGSEGFRIIWLDVYLYIIRNTGGSLVTFLSRWLMVGCLTPKTII